MRDWIFAILLSMLTSVASATDVQLKLPSLFSGATLTPDMVKVIQGESGTSLVALMMPPGTPATIVPMDAFRSDMVTEGQLVATYHLHLLYERCADGSLTTVGRACKNGSASSLLTEKDRIDFVRKLRPEQQYSLLFCLANKQEHGFSCKDTDEALRASRDKPWWIPIIIFPQEGVGKLTEMLTSRPVPPEVTRVASSATQMQQAVRQMAPNPETLIPWSDTGAGVRTAPPEMQWFEGPVPEYLRQDYRVTDSVTPPATQVKQVEKSTSTANGPSGPERAKRLGPGGPRTKDRTQ